MSDAHALAEMERGFWALMAENAELLVALRQIEDLAPATQETSLAHEMAGIARDALAKAEAES